MRKVVFMVLFLGIVVSAFGQQFLWSTVRDTDTKYIPLNNVTNEVLKIFDQYELYYDYSGFNKDRFIEYFDYGFEDWDWLYEIKEPTVFASRSNSGRGSVVLVMCVSDENVNTVIFSNSVIERDFIMIYSFDREKFANWFKTLLN